VWVKLSTACSEGKNNNNTKERGHDEIHWAEIGKKKKQRNQDGKVEIEKDHETAA